ncbi:MAG: nucleotide exchange factor GrpE [Peptoniphilaceae bacterium]|nr:nucleotide exchange factor GrpE [Peptoniphilaceae bacterium]MDY6085430.1 nucleotide exchange factor GrpE [Peptoniphilaceae bacterium]
MKEKTVSDQTKDDIKKSAPEDEAKSEETKAESFETAAEETAEETSTKETEEESSAKTEEPPAQEADEPLRLQLVRLQADFQNYRKRVERDRESTVRFANEKLLRQLLEVVDNFERALGSEKEHDQFYQGMELIHQQFVNLLTNNGLEEIESDGEAFDPNLHQAVSAEESDTVASHHVIATLQKGYRLNGKVIRPAMVKVAK